MDKEIFWKYIEEINKAPIEYINKVGYEQAQFEIMKGLLIKNEIQSVVKFHNIFCEYIRKLFLPKIGELFVLTAYKQEQNNNLIYISEDGFVDFRAWIISLGRINYNIFLNFNHEDELLEFDMNPNTAYREDLVYICLSVFKEVNVNNELEFYLNGDTQNLYSKMQWKNLDKKYPKLFVKYHE